MLMIDLAIGLGILYVLTMTKFGRVLLVVLILVSAGIYYHNLPDSPAVIAARCEQWKQGYAARLKVLESKLRFSKTPDFDRLMAQEDPPAGCS